VIDSLADPSSLNFTISTRSAHFLNYLLTVFLQAPKCNGENAPAAKDGEFGGRIELELSSTVHGQILVSGTVGAQTMVRKFVPSGRRLLLESRGGGGQDGGEGGRGGSGEQGRQGKDATQSQPGSVCHSHNLGYGVTFG